MHYQQLWKRGYVGPRQLSKETKYRKVGNNNEHILVAERALGRPLPKGAIVHHVDLDGRNNHQSNLVICQDQAFHMLLHKRQRAQDACGNANYLKCEKCKQWDDPGTMYIRHNGKGQWHRACGNAARTERKRAAKQQEISNEH